MVERWEKKKKKKDKQSQPWSFIPLPILIPAHLENLGGELILACVCLSACISLRDSRSALWSPHVYIC